MLKQAFHLCLCMLLIWPPSNCKSIALFCQLPKLFNTHFMYMSHREGKHDMQGCTAKKLELLKMSCFISSYVSNDLVDPMIQ